MSELEIQQTNEFYRKLAFDKCVASEDELSIFTIESYEDIALYMKVPFKIKGLF